MKSVIFFNNCIPIALPNYLNIIAFIEFPCSESILPYFKRKSKSLTVKTYRTFALFSDIFHKILFTGILGCTATRRAVKDRLAQTDIARRDLHQLILVDVLKGLLQTQDTGRHKADGLIGG